MWRSTAIPGLVTTSRETFVDGRGSFTKILSPGDEGSEAPFVPAEVYWSSSRRGVVRGLHVQVPPMEGRKCVFVAHGAVRDFVLDLRRGSPTFGEVHEFALDACSGGLVIPAGCAHGFEALTDDVSMVYLQEAAHSAAHDTGVSYASAGIVPTTAEPVISERDALLPRLEHFDSPFVLES